MTHNPAEALRIIADEIFERWDKDQRSGKLLTALAGRLPGYRADVDAVLAALTSHAPAGGEVQESQYNIEAIARVISLSYGEDPDEDAPLTRICTADNRPLPCWEAYREQASALMIWFSAVIDRLSPPPSPDVAGVVERIRARGNLGHYDLVDPALDKEAATLLESLSAEKANVANEPVCREMCGELAVMRAQAARIKELEGALTWYANPEVYKPHPHGLAFDDRDLSFRARTALTPKEKA